MLVEMVLVEAGAPYELREVDIRTGENRSPAFLEINPCGWVPALTTPGDETIAETPAINLCSASATGSTSCRCPSIRRGVPF